MRVTLSDLAQSEGFAPQLVRIIFHNSSAAPGEGYKVDLHWQNVGDEPAEHNYWIFVHFRPEDDLDEPYAPNGFTWDFPPALETSRWQTGFVVKEENCYFRIPPDVRPGRYMVLVGLFDQPGDGDRVQLLNRSRDMGGRRFRVGHVTVVAEPESPSRLLAYRLVWRVREPEERPALREPKYLTRGRLEVGFDPDRPIVRGWRIGGQDIALGGDAALRGPEAEFRDLQSGKRHSSLAVGADWTFNCRIAAQTATYRCRLKWKQRDVATLEIRCQVGRNGLKVRLASVTEHRGFHLLSVTLPSLVSVSADTPGAGLAIPSRGGMLVSIADSARHREVHRLSWEEPLRAAVVSSQDAAAALTAASADDCVVSEVYEAGTRRGALGVQFTTRIPAENAALEFIPRKLSECTITVCPARRGEAASWMTGAAIVAAGYRCKPVPLFCNALCYRIVMRDGQGRVQTSFQQAADLIRRVSLLTTGARQVVYLVGWDESGGGARAAGDLGGREDMVRLFDVAAGSNARVSLQIAGDRVSGSSAWFDPSHIARDGRGEMLREVSDSGPSLYFLSAGSDLAAGAAEGRVTRLLEELPQLEDSICVTVESGLASLYDHNPLVQAGADESLAARRAALDLWRKRGFEICGDGLCAPYAGVYPHFLSAAKEQVGGPFSHQEPIPFVSAVLHGRVTWGGSVDPEYGEAGLLLYGGTVNEDWTAETTDCRIMDRYYLIALPWSRIAALPIAGYSREGSVRRVTFEGGDFVEADLESRAWRMVSGGYTIAETGLSRVPRGRGDVVIYSTDARILRVPVPPGWGVPGRVRGEALGRDGSWSPVRCWLDGDRIELEVAARQPVILSRR